MAFISIVIFIVSLLMIIIGMYCLMHTHNIIRIIIAIEVAMKAITLLLAFAGNVNGKLSLTQAFIITMIVVEVVTAVVAAGIAISVYRRYGSVNIDNLTKLDG